MSTNIQDTSEIIPSDEELKRFHEYMSNMGIIMSRDMAIRLLKCENEVKDGSSPVSVQEPET